MPFSSLNFLAVAASAILALVLTPLVRALARRYGVVATPKTDRWHKKPTAMLGGVPIWLAMAISYFAFIRPATTQGWGHFPGSYLDVVMGASTFLFLVGLADDFLHTKPYQKLIGQANHLLADRHYERDKPARQHGRPGIGDRDHCLRLSRAELPGDRADNRSAYADDLCRRAAGISGF